MLLSSPRDNFSQDHTKIPRDRKDSGGFLCHLLATIAAARRYGRRIVSVFGVRTNRRIPSGAKEKMWKTSCINRQMGKASWLHNLMEIYGKNWIFIFKNWENLDFHFQKLVFYSCITIKRMLYYVWKHISDIRSMEGTVLYFFGGRRACPDPLLLGIAKNLCSMRRKYT